MSTIGAVEEVEAIRLFTQQADGGQVDSVVPLRWCLSRPAVAQLSEQKVEKPYLLLVIEQDGKESQRMVVPANEQMRYVQFRRPDKHRVHAAIVWQKDDTHPTKHLLARGSNGEYNIQVLQPRRFKVEEIQQQLDELEKAREEAMVAVRTAEDELRNQRNEALAGSEAVADLDGSVAVFRTQLINAGRNEVLAGFKPTLEGIADELSDLRGTLQEVVAEDREKVADFPTDIDPELRERKDQLTAEIDQLKAALVQAEEELPDEYRLRDFQDINHLKAEGQLEVDVPATMFGQSWGITKFLGGLYDWERAPHDQCHLRKRALWTLGTLPLVALFGLALSLFNTIAAGVLLVAGKRGVNFRPILHPYQEVPADVWDHLESSVWYQRKRRYEDDPEEYFFEKRPLALRIGSPPVMVVVGVVLILVNLIIGLSSVTKAVTGEAVAGLAVWQLVVLAIVGPLALGVALAILCAAIDKLVEVGEALGSWLTLDSEEQQKLEAEEARKKRERREERSRKEREAREAASRELELRLQQLACSNSGEATLAALPPELRTVRLRYQATKAKVCKALPQ